MAYTAPRPLFNSNALGMGLRLQNNGMNSMLGSTVSGLNQLGAYRATQENQRYKQALMNANILGDIYHSNIGQENESIDPLRLQNGNNIYSLENQGIDGMTDARRQSILNPLLKKRKLLAGSKQKEINNNIQAQRTNQNIAINSLLSQYGDTNKDGYININDLPQDIKGGILDNGSMYASTQNNLLSKVMKDNSLIAHNKQIRKQNLKYNEEDYKIRHKRKLLERPENEKWNLKVARDLYNQQLKLNQPKTLAKTKNIINRNMSLIKMYGDNPAYANEVASAKYSIQSAIDNYNVLYPKNKINNNIEEPQPKVIPKVNTASNNYTSILGSTAGSTLLSNSSSQQQNSRFSKFNNPNYWNLISFGKTSEYLNKQINSVDDATDFIKNVHIEPEKVLMFAKKNPFVKKVVFENMNTEALRQSYDKNGSFNYSKYKELVRKIPYGKDENPINVFDNKFSWNKALTAKYGAEESKAIKEKLNHVIRALTEPYVWINGKKVYQNKLSNYRKANEDTLFNNSIYNDGTSLMDKIIKSFVITNKRIPSINDFEDLLKIKDTFNITGLYEKTRLNDPNIKNIPIGRAILALTKDNSRVIKKGNHNAK